MAGARHELKNPHRQVQHVEEDVAVRLSAPQPQAQDKSAPLVRVAQQQVARQLRRVQVAQRLAVAGPARRGAQQRRRRQVRGGQ